MSVNPQLWLVLGLLLLAVLLFVRNRPRMDAVGLLMRDTLPLTGGLLVSGCSRSEQPPRALPARSLLPSRRQPQPREAQWLSNGGTGRSAASC